MCLRLLGIYLHTGLSCFEGRRRVGRGGGRRKKNPNFHHMFSKYGCRRWQSQSLSAECGESKTHQKQSAVWPAHMPLASGHLTEKIAQPHFLSPGTAGLGRDWFRDWFRFHSRALPLRGAKVEEGCCIFLQARHGQTDGHRQEPGHPGDRGCAFSFTPSVSLIPARQTGISGSLWEKKKKKKQ